MRVLWISPVNLGSRSGPEGSGGGWIGSSLSAATEFVPSLDLVVVFPSVNPSEPYSADGVVLESFRELFGGRFGALSRNSFKRCTDAEQEEIGRLVKKYKPDVIHVFGTERGFGLIGRQKDVPVVVSIQGIPSCYNEFFFAGASKARVVWKSGIKRLLNGTSWIWRYRRESLAAQREQEIFRVCDFFAGRTAWDRSIAMALGGEHRYFHLDEVLRDPFNERQWAPPDQDRIRLVTTVRGNPQKGIDLVYTTAGLLREKLNRPVEWTIIGVRSDEQAVRVVKGASVAGWENRGVKFVGRLDAEAVATKLLASDLFVFPSRADNSPNSVCEAQALGVPVVTTNAGGIPSLVEDGRTGYLANSGDPFSIAGRIMEALENPKLTRALAKRGQEVARSRHSRERIALQLIDTYSQMLESGGSS